LGKIAPPNGILAIMQQKRECFATPPHTPTLTPHLFFPFFLPLPPQPIIMRTFAYNTDKHLKEKFREKKKKIDL
jgi:hypothetical protein